MNTQKILVVEDEKPLARALYLKLTKAGYDVTNAYDGQEAIDLIDSSDYAMVLLDLVMPKLDGFAVLAHVREVGKELHIVVTSNLSQKEDIDKIKNLGAKEYFIKSNTPLAQIIEYVNTALNAKSAIT